MSLIIIQINYKVIIDHKPKLNFTMAIQPIPTIHPHAMYFRKHAFTNCCVTIYTNVCTVPDCCYQTEEKEYNPHNCDLVVISSSADVVCRECIKCRRQTTETS